MANRELLMLAGRLEPGSLINGWYCSIKYDGQRCFWDGGVSRGLPKHEVPWANNAKDGRYLESQVATGLWSRYGNVIHADKDFLDGLPPGIMLDGELWLGRGQFQETRKITSTLVPGLGWSGMKYLVFEMPTPLQFIQMGRINNPNFSRLIDENVCMNFLQGKISLAQEALRFSRMVHVLYGVCQEWKTPSFAAQTRLPLDEYEARQQLSKLLDDETSLGGEGLMLRAPGSIWVPKRSKNLLKVKPFEDDEGTVVGYTSGKEGKLLGLMGNVIVNWNEKRFELSGFTDEERDFCNNEAIDWCIKNPGAVVPREYEHPLFPRGSTIRFRHRDYTDEGIPREARYWRG